MWPGPTAQWWAGGLVTHIAAAMDGAPRMALERQKNGKPGPVDIINHPQPRQASIKPALGNLGPLGAMRISLRVDESTEHIGLNQTEHGETAPPE